MNEMKINSQNSRFPPLSIIKPASKKRKVHRPFTYHKTQLTRLIRFIGSTALNLLVLVP